jgi:hypothetical protein
MRRIAREGPRWLLLGTLVYAPWAYGSTNPETINVLNLLLGGVLLWWAARLALERRKPRIPSALLVVGGLILVTGWWMVINASAIYDSEFEIFARLHRPFDFLPGSVDRIISATWMLRATLLLGCIWFVADLVTRPEWLLRLWYTIGAAGASIALLGLLQKGSGAKTIFWQQGDWPESTYFFATYYYHANAGAFLNLILPVVAGLAWRAIHQPHARRQRAIWINAFVLVLVAVFSNTSRMSQFIGALTLVALSIGFAKPMRRAWAKADRWPVILGAVAVVVAILAVAQASHLDRGLKRWELFSKELPENDRWLAAKAAMEGVPDAGWFGFGPGTFRAVFPHYGDAAHPPLDGYWEVLHNDYLQTLLEWGVIGSILWSIVFLGGISAAISLLPRSQLLSSRWRLILPLLIVALVGVALHSAVDFPLQIASIQLYVATYVGVCWGSAGATGVADPRGAKLQPTTIR